MIDLLYRSMGNRWAIASFIVVALATVLDRTLGHFGADAPRLARVLRFAIDLLSVVDTNGMPIRGLQLPLLYANGAPLRTAARMRSLSAIVLGVAILFAGGGCGGTARNALAVSADGTGRAAAVVRVTALSLCSADGATEAARCAAGDVGACEARKRCLATFQALRPAQAAVLIAKMALLASESDDKISAAVETAKRALQEALAIWQALTDQQKRVLRGDPRAGLIDVIIVAATQLIAELIDLVNSEPVIVTTLQESEIRALDSILAAYGEGRQ